MTDGPLGILAGGGRLPAMIAEAVIGSGREVVVVAFEGQTDPDAVAPFRCHWNRMGAAGAVMAWLREMGVRDLVFAGPVKRPSLGELTPDWRAAKFLARVGVRALGDDGLLRSVAQELERDGFRVVGLHEVLKDLLTPPGVLGAVAPDASARVDIARGVEVARGLGALDVGQGAVVQQGMVLAVEAIEGTDAMLSRCAALARPGPGGVLVKMRKPQQDRRLDLPTVGVTTVEAAAAAGLRGIAVEAGGSLMIDRGAVAAKADSLGLFVVGVSAPESADEAGAGGGTAKGPHVYLLAGEPSGDLLGARLMAAIRRVGPPGARFSGVGGELMTREGLESLFPMTELSLFGVFEILPKIPRMVRRIEQTARAVVAARPDVVVTIDSPGFNARVARRVRRLAPHIPLVHYVAPTVWAWKPHRARRYAELFDHLLAILPFEPPFFTKEGLDCAFVGHSVVESGAGRGDAAAFRARHGLSESDRVVVLLPGSRRGEVDRLMPVFGETVARLRDSHGGGLVFVIPAVAAQRDRIAAHMAGWPGRSLLVTGEGEKFDAFAAGEVALAASGTVALELALARLPAVITYRLHPLTVYLYRRFIKVRYVNLVNLMLDRMLVPELLQEDCRPDLLHRALADLLDDPVAREAQVAGVAEVAAWLGDGDDPPSERAARRVLAIAGVADPDGSE